MSACGSLQQIFENPLPENPTLLESLSLNQIKTVKSIEHSSFTEIFGELHFKESPSPSPSPSSSSSNICTSSFTEIYHTNLGQNGVSGSCDINQTPSSAYVSSTQTTNHTNSHKSSDSFSYLCPESLQVCTEGLGFESSDDVEVEDLKTEMNECWQTQRENEAAKKHLPSNDCNRECKSRSRVNSDEYPPPISCIGRTGKPWVSFRSYRKNGRFVLKEIRIPTQEFLHAYREDGRLKLHFVQPDEELLEEKEDYDEEEEHDIDDYEQDCDDVESTEGEENMVKENDDCVTDKGNEDKEIDAKLV